MLLRGRIDLPVDRHARQGMAHHPSVLIVDDDAFMRELLERVFVDAGIPARTFESARQLLAQADLQTPCVLLLDVKMPEMSGPELHAVLRERGLRVPVIYLTAAADVSMAIAALRDGATDFLEKPFHSAALVERVRQALARCAVPDGGPTDDAIAVRLETLTRRERAVFDLMVTGATSKRIARVLGGSFRTIERHRGRVMSKMAASSLAHLVRMNIGERVAPAAQAP
jgi:two-component system, LuxR family, response regulator FixJ